MLVTGQVGMRELSGPVGIVDFVDTTYQQSVDAGLKIVILNLMNIDFSDCKFRYHESPSYSGLGRWKACISDRGGDTGKRVPPDKEGMVHFAGFAL